MHGKTRISKKKKKDRSIETRQERCHPIKFTDREKKN